MDSRILELDIATGLKELLIEKGFTIHSILQSSSGEMAQSLAIDEYVAKLIQNAAKHQRAVDQPNLLVAP